MGDVGGDGVAAGTGHSMASLKMIKLFCISNNLV